MMMAAAAVAAAVVAVEFEWQKHRPKRSSWQARTTSKMMKMMKMTRWRGISEMRPLRIETMLTETNPMPKLQMKMTRFAAS
jgi:hypothetical protein